MRCHCFSISSEEGESGKSPWFEYKDLQCGRAPIIEIDDLDGRVWVHMYCRVTFHGGPELPCYLVGEFEGEGRITYIDTNRSDEGLLKSKKVGK
jgi:hypothetical protein